jgi:hypothetical protein
MPVELILCDVESPCMADNNNQVQRLHHCVSKFRYVIHFEYTYMNYGYNIRV